MAASVLSATEQLVQAALQPNDDMDAKNAATGTSRSSVTASSAATTAARPKLLPIAGSESAAPLEYNFVRPSPSASAATTASATATSPFDALTHASGEGSGVTSPAFLPEMPQWKKDLIKRRKAHVARTNVASAAATLTAESDGLQTPTKDFRLGSTTVYQKQATGATPAAATKAKSKTIKTTTTTTRTSQEKAAAAANVSQQQHWQKNAKLANSTKMPATHANKTTTATTTLEKTAFLSNSAAASIGGHSTPGKEIVSVELQQQLPAAGNKQNNNNSKLLGNAEIKSPVAPIPKQRSLFLAPKAAATATPTTAMATPTGMNTGTSKSHYTKAEQETACKNNAAAPPATAARSAATHTGQEQQQHQLEAQRAPSTKTTAATNSNSATLTTRLTSSAANGERAAPRFAEHAEVDTNMSEVLVAGGSEASDARQTKCGTHAASGIRQQQQQQPHAVMPSTQIASAASIGAPSCASTKAFAMLPSQSHSKYESERTSCAQYSTTRNTASVNSASTNTNTNTELLVDTEKTAISAIAASGISSVSGSACVSVSAVHNKISTKLQSNQFIKNQQQMLASPPAKYQKYKAHNVQPESSCAIGSGAAATASTSPASSPTKTLPSQTATGMSITAAATATTTTGVNKKKMVAAQDMKKTTQNASHHHQQHHQQQQAGTCARQQLQQKQQGQSLGNGNTESAAATTLTEFDASEDLSYGPGIVSKLRCRYLTLALRESMKNQRNSLESLRRATSLNNLLDRDEHKHDDDEDEHEHEHESEDIGVPSAEQLIEVEQELEVELRSFDTRECTNGAKNRSAVVLGGGILKQHSAAATSPVAGDITPLAGKRTALFQKYGAAATATANGTRMTQSQQYGSGAGQYCGVAPGADLTSSRSRHFKRGNDSLKRARSVEALLCEKSPWTVVVNTRPSYNAARSSLTPPTCVTIEDKIHNARDRLLLGTDTMPPKRLTSIIDDTERPPPDLVKQTLKMFEATANRRGRGVNRANGTGEVASKVANYKSIIKEQKPAILFPKPPLSPTKKLGGSSSQVKPAAKPVVAAADLLSSPVGRKTVAASIGGTANNSGESMPQLPDVQHYSSTPKQKLASSALEYATPLKSPTSSSGGSSGLLSEHSPDIIPRQSGSSGKLLTGKSETFVVDSPVTALTKKLEKLRVDTDKQQQQQQQKHSDVTTKESQAKQPQTSNNKLAAAAATEPYGSAHEANKDNDSVRQEIDRALRDRSEGDNNKFVVGGDAVAVVVGSGGGGGGGDKKNERDRTALCTEPETAQAGTAATIISSDLSDDECGLTKRVTKAALENIAKAGTTQQFKFANATNKTTATAPTPAQATTTTNSNGNATATTSDIASSVLHTAPPGKQIGIIRPLLNTTQAPAAAAPTTSASNNTIHSTHIQQQQHMETLKQHGSYTQHTTYTATTAYSSSATSSCSSSSSTSAVSISSTCASNTHIALTSREIEKNRINEMKKTASADSSSTLASTINNTATTATPADVSSKSSHAVGTSLDTVINTNAGKATAVVGGGSSPASSANTSASGFSELDAVNATNSPLWALRKRRQAQNAVTENTSMVFNFSNRKEVPDYIENDGVIFRRKRELPKPNESGFVLLGDLSLETSTDTDYDDFSMCPPSPCDVEFQNANIVIDGKSSIRQKSKEATFRVQFNDTLTSTFEYPSEASLVVDDSFNDYYMSNDDLVDAFQNMMLHESDSPVHQYHHHHVAVDEIIQLPTQTAASPANSNSNSNIASPPPSNNGTPSKNILGNLPLGSAPLGFYTPIKAPIDSLFQLGVTRAPANGNGHDYKNAAANTNGNTNGTTNGVTNGSGDSEIDVNEGSIVGIKDGLNGESDEPESLQYLKPANVDLTIAYSDGTQKTDLLY